MILTLRAQRPRCAAKAGAHAAVIAAARMSHCVLRIAGLSAAWFLVGLRSGLGMRAVAVIDGKKPKAAISARFVKFKVQDTLATLQATCFVQFLEQGCHPDGRQGQTLIPEIW